MDVSLTGGRGDISVYVGIPDGEGPWPAVLIISDATGMTANLRNQVDWLASVGYLAAAPDLVHRALRQRCLFSTMRQALRGEGAVFDDFETVRIWLANHEDSTGRVAVAGFCFDGGFSLMFAGRRGFDLVDSASRTRTGHIQRDRVRRRWGHAGPDSQPGSDHRSCRASIAPDRAFAGGATRGADHRASGSVSR